MSRLLIIFSFLMLFVSAALAQESAPPATAVPPKAKEAVVASGALLKAIFTSEVKERAPVDELMSAPATVGKVFFYTEIKGLENQEVLHRWEFNGKVMSEVKFKVGASRWRMWSSKNLQPAWAGQWKVSVVDSNGKVLGEKTFDYGK